MDGTLDAEIKKTGTAEGTGTATLFLTRMIAHHQRARMMAGPEEGDGRKPEADTLGQTVITGQHGEVHDMKDSSWPAP